MINLDKLYIMWKELFEMNCFRYNYELIIDRVLENKLPPC